MSPPPARKVYFYDDDKNHNWSVGNGFYGAPFLSEKEKREADKKVKFIHIPVGESGSVDERYLAGGSDELNEANYNAQNSSLNYGWYFPESGVKTSHLKELTNDINHNKVSAIVFDFDKTLQLFEGALIGQEAKSLNEVLDILKRYNLAPMDWSKDDLATFILHDTTDPNRINN